MSFEAFSIGEVWAFPLPPHEGPPVRAVVTRIGSSAITFESPVKVNLWRAWRGVSGWVVCGLCWLLDEVTCDRPIATSVSRLGCLVSLARCVTDGEVERGYWVGGSTKKGAPFIRIVTNCD